MIGWNDSLQTQTRTCLVNATVAFFTGLCIQAIVTHMLGRAAHLQSKLLGDSSAGLLVDQQQRFAAEGKAQPDAGGPPFMKIG